MKVINCWSTTTTKGKTNPGDIVIIKNEDGKRKIEVIQNFAWYFFIKRSKEALTIVTDLKDHAQIKDFREGKEYIKIWIDKKFYKDKNILGLIELFHSKNIETYEADVGPAKRYLLDLDFEIEDFDKINLYYIDIETDDSSGNIEYESNGDFSSVKAKDRILSIALVNRKGKSYFFHDEDEKTMLEQFSLFLKNEKVDMLVGWNSKDFDIPYIWKRMDLLEIPSALIKNILHEDMMKRVQYFYSKDPEARQNITNYSLNAISEYFLGEGKIVRDGKVIDLMNEDFVKFKEYNIRDAYLLYLLENKLGLIELTYQMFQICHCTAQNWSMIKAIDNFILYEANRNKVHYPTNKAYYQKIDEPDQYLGALVLDPIPGYYTGVYDLDFKSLYPNIIRSFNISPDTISPRVAGLDLIETPGMEIDGIMKGKVYFDSKEGIIPRKIKLLLEEREKIRSKQKAFRKDTREWKDLNVKQLVVKELANSIYGVYGNIYFRSFDIDMAESITATGQYLITYLKRTFEEKERKVIYGDTDSVFVQLKASESIDKVIEQTNKELTEHLKTHFNVKESTIELVFDKKFDKFLIESKKKYVGETEGKLKFVGMESVKRDTIPLAADLQKQLISILFKERKDLCEAFIVKNKQLIAEGSYPPESILIHKKMSKDAKSYKGKADKKYTPPVHVRIAKELKIKGDKTDLSKGGSIISYIITKGDPLEGVHISEYKGEWDRKYYWNNCVYPMLERILKVAIPDVEWDNYYITEPKKLKNGNKSRGSISDKKERKSSVSRSQRLGKKKSSVLQGRADGDRGHKRASKQ